MAGKVDPEKTEPEQMAPNEVTTDPKLAQLLDMFSGEDIEKLSKLLKICGGDATRVVEAILSAQPPNVPKEPEQMAPNAGTTDPKLAQCHDMFSEEDRESHSKRRKICGGDVTHSVDAVLPAQVPDVPQVREFDCKELFQKYEDKFLGTVNTHVIAKLLEAKKVISEGLCFDLERTGNDKATPMLYLHMRDHGSLETVYSLCDVMIGARGYPKMNSLGQDMKKDLPIPKHGELKRKRVANGTRRNMHLCICLILLFLFCFLQPVSKPVEFKRECVVNEWKEDHPEKISLYMALHGAVTTGAISEFEKVVHESRNMSDFDIDCLLNGNAALHVAAIQGHVDIVEKLVELGCDMSKTNDKGVTALQFAAVNGHVDVVTKLAELGCDMQMTDSNGLTALNYAAIQDHVDVVTKLIELGCDINKTDSNGLTALHYAATSGHVDVVNKFVELGCDINKIDNNGCTALQYAADRDRVDVVAKLVELGCDMNKTDNNGWTALRYAAANGCVDVVAKLVELGCDVNQRDLNRRTALHLASRNGHVKVVTKLIELGCDMAGKTSYDGATAFHFAASSGHPDVIAELARLGMDVDETDTEGMTALHFATKYGHVNAVTKLIKLGCDKNKTNAVGQTALDIAKVKGHKDIIAKLIC